MEINQNDLDKLKSNMFKLITIPGEEVIHVIPQEYTVDGEDGIQDPKGMAGVKIEANFHWTSFFLSEGLRVRRGSKS